MIKSPIQLDSTKKRKLEKLAQVAKGGNLAILQYLFELEETIEGIKKEVPAMSQVLEKIKGKDGYNPKKGIDYNDGYTPKKGKDYKDGENYILTDADKKEIAQNIKVPTIEKVVEKHKETVIREIPIVKETIVKEPLTLKLSPQELRDLLELLNGEERLDASAIRNLESRIRELNPGNGPMLHTPALANLPDVSVVGVTTGQILQWNGTYWTNANGGGGGGSTFQTPISGALGQNTFTWASAPNVIVIDHIPYQQISKDGTINWTGTTTTVLTIFPQFDIFSPA